MTKHRSTVQTFTMVVRMSISWVTQGIMQAAKFLSFLLVSIAFVDAADDLERHYPSKDWDRELLNVVLKDVDLEGDSIEQVWQAMSSTYQIRSSLYFNVRPEPVKEVRLQRSACTVRELYDWLVEVYPTMTWSHDSDAGIVWFYPRALSPQELLADRAVIPHAMRGARVLSDVLDPLALEQGFGLFSRGVARRNTLDYSVDIPEGRYSIKEILDLCASANPKTCFFAFGHNAELIITPLTIINRNPVPGPPGAVAFWRTYVETSDNRAPTEKDILVAMSSPDRRVRWAGQMYFSMLHLSFSSDRLIRGAEGPSALAAAIGVVNLMVRDTTIATHRVALATIDRELTDEFLETGDPQLALLGALQLARVKKDTSKLEKLTTRALPETVVKPILSDIHRILRDAPQARSVLLKHKPNWEGINLSDIQEFQ
jgi:hypothetical protein